MLIFVCVLSAAQNPEAQDKCYKEIVSVIGEVPEEDRPTRGDLDNMPYLTGAIKEALRIRTVTPFLARSIPDDLNVGGNALNALRMCVRVCVYACAGGWAWCLRACLSVRVCGSTHKCLVMPSNY